jgi:predicted N-acetyltransferase YhbS
MGVVWAELWRPWAGKKLGCTIDARTPGAYLPPLMSMLQPPAQIPDTAPVLTPERPQDAAAVDGLIDRAFGPGRHVKAAERLREHNRPAPDLSFVARIGSDVVGCVRMWPIHIGQTPAFLLGPFAVDDAWRGRGLGSDLIRQACDAAQAAGHGLVLLVGDEPFFSKLGFEAVSPGRVTLPGPVDARRVLWRALKPGAADGVEGRARVA